MYLKILILKAILLIYVTSAEFNLNSLNTTNKSLDNDTFNQTKITLNTNGDNKDISKDDENDDDNDDYGDGDPIIGNEIKKQQQYDLISKPKENSKLLLNKTTTAAVVEERVTIATSISTIETTKYLKTKQNSIEYNNNYNNNDNHKPKYYNQNRKQNYHYRHYHNYHKQPEKTNHLHDYLLTTLKFNQGNSFYLNNKLKTIIEEDAAAKYNDAKQNEHNEKKKQKKTVKQLLQEKYEEPKKSKDNLKQKFQMKYYIPSSFALFGQLPQFQLQPIQQQQQQLQLYLQQPMQQEQSTTSLLLPQEYHHLSDYRFLFNAERHTEFYLHTLTNQPPDYITPTTAEVATKDTTTTTLASFKEPKDTVEDDDEDAATDVYYDNDYFNYNNNNDDDDNVKNEEKLSTTMLNLTNPRVLNVVTDTIGAVFGVNTRPVAGIQGIHIEEIELYNRLSLRQSRFNPFNPCRIIIHGWLGGSKAGIYNTLVPEYFKLQQGSYNIITVDWGKGAIADYITASYRVKPVGMIVAKFIDFLHQESGIPFENIHVIGFSMGAHIAGIAGKHVQTGRLPVIYGLDPALPLFRYENINERLDIKDADYVEVVHTSVGSYGYDHPLGHVDFYVNFGYNQPGCFFNECSHFRAFQVYAQSLNNELIEGVECSPDMWMDMIKHKRCMQLKGGNLKMGVEGLARDMLAQRRGLYYVMTNAQPPYRVM